MSGRLTKLALPVSLALNVFFAAAIANHELHRPPHPPHGPHGPHGMVEDIARALPAADALVFRREFANLPHRPPPGPGNDEFGRLSAALLADPFVPAAVEAAMRERAREHDVFETALTSALVRATTEMSAAGRRAMVEWHMTHRPPPPPPE